MRDCSNLMRSLYSTTLQVCAEAQQLCEDTLCLCLKALFLCPAKCFTCWCAHLRVEDAIQCGALCSGVAGAFASACLVWSTMVLSIVLTRSGGTPHDRMCRLQERSSYKLRSDLLLCPVPAVAPATAAPCACRRACYCCALCLLLCCCACCCALCLLLCCCACCCACCCCATCLLKCLLWHCVSGV
jgi:hypothetical protein